EQPQFIEERRTDYGRYHHILAAWTKLTFNDISNVNGGQRRKPLLFAEKWFMMESGCVDNGSRHIPHSKQASTDFAVVGAKHFLFNVPQRNGLFASKRVDTSIQVLKIRHQHDLAKVMNQSGY